MSKVERNFAQWALGFAGAAGLALLVACAAWLFTPASAWANVTLDAPVTVSDDVTRVQVQKLDAGTHEQLKGAKLQIIDQATGEVVDEWTTDGTVHELAKTLDVNVAYILREVEAPEGYATVGDTVFMVNEVEGEGLNLLDKDDSTELADSYRIVLYDQHEDVVNEIVETRTRADAANTEDEDFEDADVEDDDATSASASSSSSTSSSDNASKSAFPKTGDNISANAVMALVAVAVVALLAAAFASTRLRRAPKGKHAK